VQYHPEAAAGPHDAAYLFDRFVDLMSGFETGASAPSSTTVPAVVEEVAQQPSRNPVSREDA
jgi:carbamoyl-phosphate synthase small subunit